MAKYQAHPVDAEQWFLGKDIPNVHQLRDDIYYVHTDRDLVFLKPGDWIITDVSGGVSVMSDTDFAVNYTLADDAKGESQ